MKIVHNEVFAVRDGESTMLHVERPDVNEPCRWIAVCTVAVTLPPGEYQSECWDGSPVELAAVIAAQLDPLSQKWKWVALSPATKEFLGGMIFDAGLPKGVWYYFSFGG